MRQRRLVSFDWAIKKLLRSKVDFGILEGFLSELLRDDIRILEVLESESNKDSAGDKSNRLDIKVENHKGELLLIEVQYEREHDYLSRMYYGAAKAVVEHLDEGARYGYLVKVIAIDILYFDLGHGNDYVYWGTTRFHGLHTHDELELSVPQRKLFPGKEHTHELFPEYYLIMVDQFDDLARDTLDEWIYFLKHEEIKDEFTARGLNVAKDKLDILKLPEAERLAYERYQEDLHYQASLVASNYGLGKLEGREEGREQGRTEGLAEGHGIGLAEGLAKGHETRTIEIAVGMKANGIAPNGIAPSIIAQVTGLDPDTIDGL